MLIDGAFTANVMYLESVFPAESETYRLTLNEPLTVGVPFILPAEDPLSPDGNPEIDHE
jgi:hypothetical protein